MYYLHTCNFYLEEITSNDKKMLVLPLIDSFGTLKGLEHSVNPQLLRYARETESLNAHSRQKYRRRLFAVYSTLHHVINFFIVIIVNLKFQTW